MLSTLASASSQEEMDCAETYFISLLGSLSPNGYNLVGEGRGGRPSNETKQRLSLVWRGRSRGPMPQPQRDKISLAKRGSSPSNKGRKLTDETVREKLRRSHLGKTATPETRSKMRAAKLGKLKSTETRARMSQAAKLRKMKP